MDHIQQIKPKRGLQQRGAKRQRLTEHRLRLKQRTSHADMLRALPRKQKCHRLPPPRRGRFAAKALRRLGQACQSIRHQNGTLRIRMPPPDQGGTHSGRISSRVCRRPITKRCHRRTQCLGRGCRHRVDLRAMGGGHVNHRRGRSLLQHHMNIGATDAKGRNPRQPGHIAARPWRQLGHRVKRRSRKIHPRVWRFVMQKRRNDAVLQRQRRLDQPGNARCNIQMADIGLGRPQRTKPARIGAGRKRLMQSRKFNRVAKRCGGAMRLDIADVARGYPGCGMGGLNNLGLRLDGWGRIARLFRPVIVDGIPPDHGNHVVAVRQCIFQPAQHNQPRTIAKHRARGICIEGAAMTIRRGHRIGHVSVIAL